MENEGARIRATLDDVIDLVLSSVDKKTKDNERAVQLCNYTDVYYNSFIHASLDFMTATETSLIEKSRSVLCFQGTL